MKTIDGTPARAACAATELARLPVEAQAKRVKPSACAAVRATETTRSLNEWVGLAESSLTHSGARRPSSAARARRATSGVRPGSRVTRVGRVLAGGQQGGVAPDVLRAGLDLLPGDPRERRRVVGDLERAETLVTGVLRGERELGAAARGRPGRGRASGDAGGVTADVIESFLSSFPAATCRPGTELAPAARGLVIETARWLPGLHRAVPSAPLDEVFSCALQLIRTEIAVSSVPSG